VGLTLIYLTLTAAAAGSLWLHLHLSSRYETSLQQWADVIRLRRQKKPTAEALSAAHSASIPIALGGDLKWWWQIGTRFEHLVVVIDRENQPDTSIRSEFIHKVEALNHLAVPRNWILRPDPSVW
jgi:hypothetical protein